MGALLDIVVGLVGGIMDILTTDIQELGNATAVGAIGDAIGGALPGIVVMGLAFALEFIENLGIYIGAMP